MGLLSGERELGLALERIAPRADAVFLREPAIDPQAPDTSDLDLLAFGPVDDLLPERIFFPGGRPIDLIWLPSRSLDDPEAFAKQGVLPHRLLSSRPIHDRTGGFERSYRLVERAMFDPAVRCERTSAFLDLGFLTVREVGITWDFPGLALFWLHMAYAALLAALADSTRTLCPNVYTRPFDYAFRLEELTGLSLVETYVRALALGQPLGSAIEALTRVHRVVATRFPEPAWPDVIRNSTRHEYRYFLSPQELDWRIAAASEMERRGNSAGGVFYLRLLAYALARVPSVHRHAVVGEDASFLRPRRAMGGELRSLCPEIVADLERIFGGESARSWLRRALESIRRLKTETLLHLESRGVSLPRLREWTPFRSEPETPKEDRIHAQDSSAL